MFLSTKMTEFCFSSMDDDMNKLVEALAGIGRQQHLGFSAVGSGIDGTRAHTGSRTRGGPGQRVKEANDSEIRHWRSCSAPNAAEADAIDSDQIQEKDKEYRRMKWGKYPPIQKDFYIKDADVANLQACEVERIRMDNRMTVQRLIGDGGHIPNPIRTFPEAFSHYPEILEEMRKAGLERPSPIQRQAWPIILRGNDLIAVAQGDVGKRLAYILAAYIHVDGQLADRRRRGGANVLILTPTRRHVLQIEEEVRRYKYKDIKCVCLYGSGDHMEQIDVVTSCFDIIVATPDRLIFLMTNEIVDVKSVTYLVLEEVDRMLDMGFQPDIVKILLVIRSERQTVMTSATWPAGVQYLATRYSNNPVFVGSMVPTPCHSILPKVVMAEEDKKYVPTPVLQKVVMVEEDKKYEALASLWEREIDENDEVIVFIGHKEIADHLSARFAFSEIDCLLIHASQKQTDQEKALGDFEGGAAHILLATGVASQWIGIKDIKHVINYDCPHSMEEYADRVGHAPHSGQTITFMTRGDWSLAQELIEFMLETSQRVPQELHDMAAQQG